MGGVVFKNLGQKFPSIIHAADLSSNSLFALCAASSLPPWQREFRPAGKAEFGAPAGRDTAGTRARGTPRESTILQPRSSVPLGERAALHCRHTMQA